MTFDFKKIKTIDWVMFFKRNKYSFISFFILALYFYATFSAVVFIAANMRRAFSIDEKTAERSIISFDRDGYEKIAGRFEGSGK